MNKTELRFKLIMVAEEYLEECGCCGCWHPNDWYGDCRDDSHRYGSPEDLADKWLGEDYDSMIASEQSKAKLQQRSEQ